MQNVVGHDNGTVYHQIQRDSDTRQRIKLHLKSEEVVEDKCYRYIYSQAGNYQKKIFQLTSNEKEYVWEDMPVENDLSHWVWTYTFTNADYDAAVAQQPVE